MTAATPLRERLAELISVACDREVSAAAVAASAAPLSALGVGSLALLRLIDAIEDEFGMLADPEEAFRELGDLDSLTAWLRARVEEAR